MYITYELCWTAELLFWITSVKMGMKTAHLPWPEATPAFPMGTQWGFPFDKNPEIDQESPETAYWLILCVSLTGLSDAQITVKTLFWGVFVRVFLAKISI